MSSISPLGSTDSITTTISEYTPSMVVRALKAIRSSFLLFIAVAGIVSFLIGLILYNGILAGMFGVWGISAIVAVGIAYAVLSILQ